MLNKETSAWQILVTHQQIKNRTKVKEDPRSIILTAMAGGTQLFEGAHLTIDNRRFCQARVTITRFLWVK